MEAAASDPRNDHHHHRWHPLRPVLCSFVVLNSTAMRRINLIICHCSATRVTRDFSPEDLEACHKARGYKTTGYHYYITKDGKLHKCRPEDMIGAHARRYNARAEYSNLKPLTLEQ